MDGKKIIVDIAVALADGYQKLKDCMPDEIKSGLDDLENNILEIGKEIAFEIMKRKKDESAPEKNKSAKKVDISFGGEEKK